MNVLPINLDDLIHARSVESVRREFKKTWTPQISDSTLRSICAFANDFFNLNGGYIIIGIEDRDGQPILPPHGLDGQNLDDIQKWIRGNCKRISPEYQPVLSPEIYQEKQILVIWIPAGDVRPYQAPETTNNSEKFYYVRQGSESVKAKDDILTQLMQMAAKVPFDDRRNLSISIDKISPGLVREFLSDIKSDLVSQNVVISDHELYRHLRITAPINSHEVPKNIALLFFVHNPEEYFPGARIEIVQFGDDAGGDLIEEKIFRGPLHLQLRQALDYLNTFSTTMIRKVPNQATSYRTVAYPYEAMEEALVNAVYHRSYEGVQEPVKVYLYPDRLEIISYPGPVQGIERKHLQPGATIPPVPYRNRRIGDFLKDLALAETRGTGIPKIRRKMRENGSPDPSFNFDDARSYFQVILPAHPQYVVIHAIRESAHLWAVGERQRAISNLESALNRVPKSGALIAQIIEYRTSLGEFSTAEKLFRDTEIDPTIMDRHLPFIAIAKILLDRGQPKRASEILEQAPSPIQIDDIVELAVLYKRAKRFQEAHQIFTANYELIKDDPKSLQEYAQTKINLAYSLKSKEIHTKKRLNREAVELLRRAIQLSDDPVRNAWCWFDLAKVLNWLRAPETEILQAYSKAMELLPYESRFNESYNAWRLKKRAIADSQ
ncbi:putative DNA binding domain-containing protein [Nostoc sp. CENA67]|uniref:Putative DNA binding domain-containing protein n=1 Tax=Amazonocrinis nigriterrae CENA67 TaxID=2794033 RepID=A0A8J7I188_9NOST|nr:RNA-binding domain-containing protein [Amazonocrinis nigriterrae]MBH8566169.1 putative DNA binding domain-containing protein [Amazonocrinis nigriterrae CENA67]